MKEMKHENLVQFFGVCTEPPNVCLVMQYCRKGSLKVSVSLSLHVGKHHCRTAALLFRFASLELFL